MAVISGELYGILDTFAWILSILAVVTGTFPVITPIIYPVRLMIHRIPQDLDRIRGMIYPVMADAQGIQPERDGIPYIPLGLQTLVPLLHCPLEIHSFDD
jgi:hypothetical protein